MPYTLRLACMLACLSVAALFLVPPSSRYLALMREKTLPRLSNTEFNKSFARGITYTEWSRNWVPLPAAKPDLGHTPAQQEEGVKNGSLLLLGRHWYSLVILYYGWIIMLVMSLASYMLARLNARTLPSPPVPLLIVCLLTLASIYPFHDPVSTPPSSLGEMRVSAGSLMGVAWSVPLVVFVTALIASLIPFTHAEPRPTMYQRFLTLLRDGSFLSLTAIALVFYITSLNVRHLEGQLLPDQKGANKPPDPPSWKRGSGK